MGFSFGFSDAPNVDAITQKEEVVERNITSRKRKFSEEQSDSQVRELCEEYVQKLQQRKYLIK